MDAERLTSNALDSENPVGRSVRSTSCVRPRPITQGIGLPVALETLEVALVRRTGSHIPESQSGVGLSMREADATTA